LPKPERHGGRRQLRNTRSAAAVPPCKLEKNEALQRRASERPLAGCCAKSWAAAACDNAFGMIYCFDTSALNRLQDDRDREPLVQGLLATGSFVISAHNVVEAVKTRDEERRVALVELMKRLARNKRPLDRPSGIVRSVARAFATNSPTLTVNADPTLEGVWMALNQPDQLNEKARQDAIAWLSSTTADFDGMVSAKRKPLQEIYRAVPAGRPRTAAAAIREYFRDHDSLHLQFAPKYERETQMTLSRQDLERILKEPLFALYFGGQVYGIYQRAIREEGYSAKHHANTIDLGQAVYLPMCDRFVTDDLAQYRALRLLNRFNTKRRTEVVRYDTFRKRFL
jgi:hypothetical protein